MNLRENNYAFIDSQNVNLGIQDLGWKLNWRRFRIYLRDKFKVTKAFLFLGYMKRYQNMYDGLRKDGYILVFKPIVQDRGGMVKGNCDGELILQAMIELTHFDKALIATGDGDFYCLIKYLYKTEKLLQILAPNPKYCSSLIKRSAGEKLEFMDELKQLLEYK